MDNQIIVLTGLSGAGKDAIADYFKEDGYNFAVLHSTRPMRKGESEGLPYHFITDAEFSEMEYLGEFIEARNYHTEFNGEPAIMRYGLSHKAIEPNKRYVVVFGVQAAHAFMSIIGDRAISVGIEVNEFERMNRAQLRGSFDQIEWDNRAKLDRKKFPGGLTTATADIVVTNYTTAFDTYNEIVSRIADRK